MHRRFPRRAGPAAVLPLIALLTATLLPWTSGAHAAAPAHGGVTMRVVDVSPDAPASSRRARRLDVVLSFHNSTDQTLQVAISADRGFPIESQRVFDRTVAHPKAPDPSALVPIPTRDGTLAPTDTLAPGDSSFVFRTSTGIYNDAKICECADAIYPIYFTATTTTATGGAVTALATARTFIPSMPSPMPGDGKPISKLQVGWVWPLLDRPHRLGVNPAVFTDDDLAGEIAPGGRLDTLLTIVQRVAEQVPMTLVVDPDLIDELQVMSQGPYQLRPPGKPLSKVSTGTAAARTWLQRLRNVLSFRGMEIDLTPAGDPDVDSLARNGLPWTVGLSQEQQSDVTAALGGQTPLSDIAWPVHNELSAATLDELVAQGTNTVILADSALHRSRPLPADVEQDALAPLPTDTGSAEAVVTSTPLQRLVAQVLDSGPDGLATLPQLDAMLALRVINSPHRSHFVALAPPRDLGTNQNRPLDISTAVRLILQTAHTSWATAKPLRAAASSTAPVDHGRLRATRAVDLSPDVLDAARYVTESLPGLYSLFPDNPADAAQLHLDTLPITVQRLESASLLHHPRISTAAADRVRALLDKLRQKSVYLVPPANGRDYTYTLTSNKSSVTVTVVNNLAVPVKVGLQVSRTSGPPGFTAGNIGAQQINPGLKKQIKIPTQVSVLGHYQIGVQLTTPSGLPLGSEVQLSVRSTALGTIGIVITVVAGVVLAIALLVRLITRVRRGRRKSALRLATPPNVDTPVVQ